MTLTWLPLTMTGSNSTARYIENFGKIRCRRWKKNWSGQLTGRRRWIIFLESAPDGWSAIRWHTVQFIGLNPQNSPDCIDKKLFLKNQKYLLSLFLMPFPVNQPVIYAASELFPAFFQ